MRDDEGYRWIKPTSKVKELVVEVKDPKKEIKHLPLGSITDHLVNVGLVKIPMDPKWCQDLQARLLNVNSMKSFKLEDSAAQEMFKIPVLITRFILKGQMKAVLFNNVTLDEKTINLLTLPFSHFNGIRFILKDVEIRGEKEIVRWFTSDCKIRSNKIFLLNELKVGDLYGVLRYLKNVDIGEADKDFKFVFGIPDDLDVPLTKALCAERERNSNVKTLEAALNSLSVAAFGKDSETTAFLKSRCNVSESIYRPSRWDLGALYSRLKK